MTIRCVPPCIRLVVWAAVGMASALSAAEPTGDAVLFDMDTVRHKMNEITTKDKRKVSAGSVEVVEGKFGKACKFSFVEGARGGFATSWIHADPSGWDQAEGVSFWVKGDGSQSWGGLEVIDGSNYRLRYGYCFPVDSTEWTKVTVPWSDLIPELAGLLVGADGGYAPSGFRNFWFGKWHYWRDYPAHSFAIDQVQIERQIDIDTTDYAPEKPGIARVLAKLKAGQPVTIVTMGDSLSDKRHWANRYKLWSELLCEQLGAKYGAEIKLVNPAIGGTSLSQNLITMPRWLKTTPRPDLVTVCFGYNDFDNGVRGPRFAEYLRFGVDRIRCMTGGQTDILLITTCPAHGRWTTLNEMARAVHDVARERKTGFADIATAFHRAGSPQAALAQGYWAWDKTHLGDKGHQVVAETVFRAIQSAGLADFDNAEDTLWWQSLGGTELTEP